jgi:phage terminase large subunit-like protein
LADAWALETTTAPAPGEGSVAESTMAYARQVFTGAITDSRLFYFHRQASDAHDLTTDEGVRAAVLEASGPVAEWSDIDAIVEQWRDPSSDRTYLERVWLNRVIRGAERAFDAEAWRSLVDQQPIPERSLIVLGFDGSRRQDATALVATHVLTGIQWPIGIWQRPLHVEDWEVPVHEVDVAVAAAFRRYNVWRLYADPPYWETYIAKWAGEFGAERVVEWWTNRQKPMAYAVRAYAQAIGAGEVKHNGDRLLAEHIGNAVRRPLAFVDEDGKPLWVIQKERPDSPAKIDAAMAAVLAWEARNDAVAKGIADHSVYEDRGLLVV